MEISDSLQTLYSAEIDEQDDGSFCIEVPEQEVVDGSITEGETVRVAILSHPNAQTPEPDLDEKASSKPSQPSTGPATNTNQAPPVSEGEVRKVEIENIGDQGDGIAKVESGFVVIVPDTRVGQEPRVRINDVRDNVAFAEIA
ncbi:TRAM domain-containing protein [Halorubrum pallidum]|uniref:TRAM domain-containing protein n=1 Tax=Halorubrum pallidum TaxID=1526114 RepID=A0ABD5T402_9EURY